MSAIIALLYVSHITVRFRDGGDAALAPRPPPMVGDIPPCPRAVSWATLSGPVSASRSL